MQHTTEGPGAKLRGLRHPFGTSVCYTVMERGGQPVEAHILVAEDEARLRTIVPGLTLPPTG